MGGNLYIGNSSGVSKIAKKIYVGDPNDQAAEVKKIYVGDPDGLAVKVWPQDSPVIPSEYQQVEYVTPGGNLVVPTELIPTNNTRVVVDMLLTSAPSSTSYMFGVYANSMRYGLLITTNKNVRYFCGSTSYVGGTDTLNLNQRYVIDFNNNGSFYINGTLSATTTVTTFSMGVTLRLFGNQSSGASAFMRNVYLYSCKIYDGTTLVRNLVPVRPASTTSFAGLYDSVFGAFYKSETAGQHLLPGPDVA